MQKKYTYSLFIFLCLFWYSAVAQNKKIDSLLTVLKINTKDTNRVNCLVKLAREYRKVSDNTSAMKHSQEALVLSETLGFKKGMANSNNLLGNINSTFGNFAKALEYHNAALKLRIEIGNEKAVADSYMNLGTLYTSLSNHERSLEMDLAALKIREKLGDKDGVAGAYNNIGATYQHIGDMKRSLKNFEAALAIKKELGTDKYGIAFIYNNMGLIKYHEQNFEKGLEYHLAAMALRKEINDKAGMASSYNHIGAYYRHIGDKDKALKNFQTSLKLEEEIGNAYEICELNLMISELYVRGSNIDMARKYQEKFLNMAIGLGLKNFIASGYYLQAQCDSAENKYADAYDHYLLFKQYTDSVFNEESYGAITKMSAKYDSEKKDLEIKLLNKDKETQTAITEAESKKQKIIIWSVVGGLLLVIFFSIFIYGRWRITQKQKLIIEKQKELVEEKQKEVLDSIRYAKRIQTSLMPTEKYFERKVRELKGQ